MQRFYEGECFATNYRMFRPTLPKGIVKIVLDYLEEQLPRPHGLAIDVGCGSGQVALPMAPHFRQVSGFDIGEAQIAEALRRPDVPEHVSFAMAPAERLPVLDRSAELIVGGMSFHWFDFKDFYSEVERVLVPNGVVAAICQQMFKVVHSVNSVEINQLIKQLVIDYAEDVAKTQATYVLDDYRNLPLPYSPRLHQSDSVEFKGSVADVIGYLSTLCSYETPKMKAVLKAFKERFYEMLEVEGSPEEVPATLRYDYAVAMCRKPSQ